MQRKVVVITGATSGIGGEYFYKCRPATPTAPARDDAAATRLWTESARIAGF
jgi:hypothetical protein